MVLYTDKIQKACSKILSALDINFLVSMTEYLEIIAESNRLCFNVTNGEYYVKFIFEETSTEEFHAVVSAKPFLKLISSTNKKQIELVKTENSLQITAEGIYNVPLIDTNILPSLPAIELHNITNSFTLPSATLNSILTFNGAQFCKSNAVDAVQTLYYLDEKGAITFVSGACVNNFRVQKPFKALLNQRLVKLFRLFTSPSVTINIAYDPSEEQNFDGLIPKISFITDNIEIYSFLPRDNSLFDRFPVERIRARASTQFLHSVSIDRNAFLNCVSRLLIFNENEKEYYATFSFKNDGAEIKTMSANNAEVVSYTSCNPSADINYQGVLDLVELKNILESLESGFITLSFGDNTACVLSFQEVSIVLPEGVAENVK